MTYDASSRKDIRRAEKAAAELERSHTDFIVAAMSTVPGRAWFYHRLAACACFTDIPSFDPHRDYFSAGRRSVGLQDLAAIQTHCPDQYLQMIREENVRLATLTAVAERSGRQEPDRGTTISDRDLWNDNADADDFG